MLININGDWDLEYEKAMKDKKKKGSKPTS